MYKTSEDIPSIPFFKTPEEYHNFCYMLIENGAIPKNKLKNKTKYYGTCRNADYAIWDADSQKFYYERWKFGIVSVDYINHFEDDDGSDLFIPIKEIVDIKADKKREDIKKSEETPKIEEEIIIENIRSKKINNISN